MPVTLLPLSLYVLSLMASLWMFVYAVCYYRAEQHEQLMAIIDEVVALVRPANKQRKKVE